MDKSDGAKVGKRELNFFRSALRQATKFELARWKKKASAPQYEAVPGKTGTASDPHNDSSTISKNAENFAAYN